MVFVSGLLALFSFNLPKFDSHIKKKWMKSRLKRTTAVLEQLHQVYMFLNKIRRKLDTGT